MNQTQELKTLAIAVNDFLTEYVKIHDKILNTAGKSIHLTKKIDFGELLDDCKKISEKSKQKKEDLYLFQSKTKNEPSDIQKKYLNSLILFAEKLDATISILTEKQELLLKVSGGDRTGAPSRQTYSLLSRLMWLPVVQSSFGTFFMGIIVPTIILSILYNSYAQEKNYLKVSIICFVICSWLFSLLYGKSRQNPAWKKYSEAEKRHKQSVNEYLAVGEELNKLNKIIFCNT